MGTSSPRLLLLSAHWDTVLHYSTYTKRQQQLLPVNRPSSRIRTMPSLHRHHLTSTSAALSGSGSSSRLSAKGEASSPTLSFTCPKFHPPSVEEESVEKLWQEFFSDPSKWWDHRFNKRTPCYPDFKHKHTKEALWVDKISNPIWVKTELAALPAGAVQRSVFSWNAFLRQLIKDGHYLKVIKLYRQMKKEGLNPDTFTFATVSNACGRLAAIEEGRRVHIEIIQYGFQSNLFVGNALIDMYARCGSIEEACRVFKSLPNRDVVCWTSIIGACVKCGQGGKALELFRQMQVDGVEPNTVTFVGALNACSSVLALDKGRGIHVQVLSSGLKSDDFVGSALIDMYAKCGSIEEARRVFENMHTCNLVCWTAIIFAYAKSGLGEKALELYFQMQLHDIEPDKVTFVGVLNACASIAALEEGRYIHSQILRNGFELDDFVQCALVDMYGKCDSIEDACRTFNSAHSRGVVCWNAMIQAFVKCGLMEEALELYQEMHSLEIDPDIVTYTCILNACASVAALEEGRRVHAKIIQSGCKVDAFVVSCLIDMYSKSGSIEDAYRVFISSCNHDCVSWTAMIGAFAMHGRGKEAIQTFNQMCRECVQVNDVTFVCIFSACSHACLVNEGHYYFECLNPVYGVSATVEHFICMIDLLGRVGYLVEAESMIKNMPCDHNVTAWSALLAACRTHGNVEMGERIAERALKLNPDCASGYVLLSNLYAGAGMWERGDRVHQLRINRQVHKQPGCSWIEMHDHIQRFSSNDRSHPQIYQIHAELKSLSAEMKKAGYLPERGVNMHALEDKDKEVSSYYHSERLAIGFGLISSPPGNPLCIVKNLRVCVDCHTSIKFISKIVERVMVVRDARRFHRFENGSCSCGDYW
ncbi:hypothetical protein O6H91_06G037400 [Diphasiastrum complanatum]|uniref:Uncharacterized protein n=4 Tax=Diphasiastrum complanatum TaxID=34168 RepID=A0ACC2DCY3_DIPCM|nr:hypothetical protein O6H91_06G037400 [Diphasiastrum complanatum]KAJ7551990.1 hypothetical protein O6H91_06G037400 [Diphasiastrum complanatum]KAJ7551991.1 hypothetical protein O6H91_06G037400 [Diphasiastrum complanatum]KAJ7551992.1 hypothetical protein O6H91_06G037400 [Diphasiastrum complanatum]